MLTNIRLTCVGGGVMQPNIEGRFIRETQQLLQLQYNASPEVVGRVLQYISAATSLQGFGGATDGDRDAEEPAAMVRYDLPKRKETTLMEELSLFELSADLSTVAALKDEDGEARLRVYKAGEKPLPEDDDDE